MRESSSANASTRQVQAEAKSLFGNILAVSPCRSKFCPDHGMSRNDKPFEISILAVEREKNGKRYIQSEPQAGGRAPYPKLRRIMGSKTLVVLIVSATICSAGMLTGQTQSAPEVVEKLGRGMSPPRVTYSPPPQYSEKARVAKYQATCILKLIVGADGNPRNIRVINPIGLGLDEKALEAVRTWRFQPALKDGKPVAVEIAVEVDFHLYGIGERKIADLTARANAGDAQAQLDARVSHRQRYRQGRADGVELSGEVRQARPAARPVRNGGTHRASGRAGRLLQSLHVVHAGPPRRRQTQREGSEGTVREDDPRADTSGPSTGRRLDECPGEQWIPEVKTWWVLATRDYLLALATLTPREVAAYRAMPLYSASAICSR